MSIAPHAVIRAHDAARNWSSTGTMKACRDLVLEGNCAHGSVNPETLSVTGTSGGMELSASQACCECNSWAHVDRLVLCVFTVAHNILCNLYTFSRD